MKILDILEELEKVTGSDEMDSWLFTPNKAFEDLTPIQVIANGQLSRIYKMIQQINDGVAN